MGEQSKQRTRMQKQNQSQETEKDKGQEERGDTKTTMKEQIKEATNERNSRPSSCYTANRRKQNKASLKGKNYTKQKKKSTGLKDLKDMKMIKPSWPKRQ